MAADDQYDHGGISMAYVLLYVKIKHQPHMGDEQAFLVKRRKWK
jgi:hypothetical protein